MGGGDKLNTECGRARWTSVVLWTGGVVLHRRLSIAGGLDRGETLCYLGSEDDALARSIEWLLRIWVAIVRWPLGGPRKNVHSVENTAPGTTWSGAVHNAIDLSAAPGRVPRGFYCASPPMMLVVVMAMTDLVTSKVRSVNKPLCSITEDQNWKPFGGTRACSSLSSRPCRPCDVVYMSGG